MKKETLMVALLCVTPLMAELSVAKIDKMVEDIQGKRKSRVNVQFDQVISPFAVIVQKDVNATPVMQTVEQQVNFQLKAIINDEANINGRWLKPGDEIQGYKVEKIEEGHVVLRKQGRSIELFLPNPAEKNLLQISEG
jgi:hypothetical protein